MTELCDSGHIDCYCCVSWQGNERLHNWCHVAGKDDVGADDVGRYDMAYDGVAAAVAAAADSHDIEDGGGE